MVSYNRFIELEKKAALHFTGFVMSDCIGECTGLSFTRSTKSAVCMNQRINAHKQFKGLAQRGHTSVGCLSAEQVEFHGFKLHLIINDQAEIISVQLTRGNVADNNENLLLKLCKEVFGKIYEDKGYLINVSFFEKLFADGVQIITTIRKNMRNKLMSIFNKIMLRKRSVIECVMDSLKNICNIEHSLHRSIHGFLIYTFAAIGAYHFMEKKPSLSNQFEFDNSQLLQLYL